ncbi:Exo-poly-alpha-D-galacturonosidase [termite gut metagenome]|uniref:Exo-poly-alpha-D-galacturonosidase n=1 Tax=termite gut metagenome TaxID=433724 RepID=A0A5J4SSZ5_9ZZZZ
MNAKFLYILFGLIIVVTMGTMGCSNNDDSAILQGDELNITDYGVVPDGVTNNTVALQKALDDCSKRYATLIVPAGVYLTGPLFLKSNTTLKLEKDAVLLGIDDMEAYAAAFYPAVHGSAAASSIFTPALLYAGGESNITITGEGTLDGQGDAPGFPQENNATRRPKLIFMVGCRNVTVENIKLRNSAFWSSHYLQCDGVTIRNIDIYSHTNWNNDGIDIDSKNVLVENCTIDVDDDGVCLKSDRYTLCENVVVKDCIIKSNCNAIKFGTSSYGGFKNVQISHCTISKASEDNIRHWQTAHDWANVRQPISVLGGIAVESVDGGILEDVTISDIVISDVLAPIFVRLGDRHKTYSSGKVSVLKNVTIQNVTATGVSSLASSITAVDGSYAENVVIKNVSLTVPGGGTSANISVQVPENKDAYPEATMFKTVLPAYGFYVRHVKGIIFENVKVTVDGTTDARPLFYYDDVIDAVLTGSRPEDITDSKFLRQKNCSNIKVDGVTYEGAIIGDGGNSDPNQGILVVGNNTYTTYDYNGVVWMVTNSKEGTPTDKQYDGHLEGENGYYYASKDKESACPAGWRLPTIAEATALADLINADPEAENVRWWVNGEYSAFAGIRSGSGTWMFWGTQGTWRIGNGKTATPDDDTWVYSTLSSYPDNDITHIPHRIVEDGVNDSNRVRYYSVRCVKIKE